MHADIRELILVIESDSQLYKNALDKVGTYEGARRFMVCEFMDLLSHDADIQAKYKTLVNGKEVCVPVMDGVRLITVEHLCSRLNYTDETLKGVILAPVQIEEIVIPAYKNHSKL